MTNLSSHALIEKIIRAKVKLEGARKSHHDSCLLEDPHSPASCNCGAGPANRVIDDVLRELKLDD